LLPSAGVRAQDEATQAEAAYQKGLELQTADPSAAREQFRQAAHSYEQLVQAGQATGPLFYNLGNACLQAGDVGRAVFYYRRAERLMPGDERLQAALGQVRALLGQDMAPEPPAWQRLGLLTGWLGRLSRLLLGVSIALVGWLGLWLTRRRHASGLAAVAVAAILVGTAWGGFAGWQFLADRLWPPGVVAGEQAVLREGNGPAFRPIRSQPLPPGAEFRVLNEKGDWLQVRLATGQKGWLPRAGVLLDQ
jgi:tetratricopeptide (TPR) repeat protein